MITQKINLNLIPNGVMPRVNVSQYDYGSRTLEITLYNGASLFTIPTGAQIVIQGTKKDNRGFQYVGLEFSGSVVTADITQQMTVFEDEVQVELVIITGSGDNTQQLATANFILNVEPAALKSDIVVSETDIPAIQTLPEAMAEVEAAVELIETALPAIEGAEAWAVGTKDGVPVTSEDEQYHNNSKYYAEQASTSETNAGLSASAASGSATSASGSAEDAEAYGIGKRGGVNVESGDVAYHNNSRYYAGLASNSANNASTSETNAGLSASAASGSADQAEAWATGEIDGTPVGSDKPQYHNSAKYWAEQASQAAGGGVTSFNGRNGSVSPAADDYSIDMISPTIGTTPATQGQVPIVGANGEFEMGTVDEVAYGICSVAQSTAAKTVTVPKFSLETGSKVIVKFTHGNTASNPTLNVNNTGAKAIYQNGSAIESELEENGTYQFVYNGTQYDLIGGGSDLSDYAKQEELSNLVLTGTTNTSGATIAAGTCFVLNGDFVTAKVNIASGATFTLNTNYEKKSVGSILTELNSNFTYKYVNCNNCTSYDEIYNMLKNGINLIGQGDIGQAQSTNLKDLIGEIGGNYTSVIIRYLGNVGGGFYLTITAFQMYGHKIHFKYAVNLKNGYWETSEWTSYPTTQ